MWRKLGAVIVAACVVAPVACFDFGNLSDSPVDGGGSACSTSQKSCLGKCVDVSDPSVGCSGACTACNAAPNSQAACALQGGSETCSVGACNPQFGDCDNDPTNGCETHTTTRSNCGACGHDCLQEFCELQAGGDYACSATCDPPNVKCGGDAGSGSVLECVDLNSDNANCGACGHSCTVANGSGTCEGGSCKVSCSANYFQCGGACVLASDSQCGASCLPCAGSCNTTVGSPGYGTCGGGGVTCEGGVVDLTRSPNCGACGVDCEPPKECCKNLEGKISCSLPLAGAEGGSSGETCNP